MDVEELNPGQNLIVLRFSLGIRKDIIEEHMKLIKKNGYVWYGKLSGVTSERIISAIMNEEKPALILYSRGVAFLCELMDFSTKKPKEGYPSYYDEEYIYPSCYFKLKSINEVTIEILRDLYVRSSKRRLSDVFSKQCMASSLFVSYKKILEIMDSHSDRKLINQNNVGKNECIYRIDKRCNLKKCINYGYECERPSFCAKQKR